MALASLGSRTPVKTGWVSRITLVAIAALLYLSVSGLLIRFAPFLPAMQWTVLLHTALGLLFLAPILWYGLTHWLDYKHFRLSDTVLLGYVAAAALVVCLASGMVVTWQGLFGARMSPAWRSAHLWSTFALLGTTVTHAVIVWVRGRRRDPAPSVRPMGWWAALATAGGLLLAVGLGLVYAGPRYANAFPDDYQFLYGEDRPFAPSLALTSTGGAFDAESLAGSETCGTSGCHSQILEEWRPSAHRYAAMDPLFQAVQSEMAKQNGPESTRYCGGCHDPISLFSGTKNIFVEDLTGLHGFQEGVSCLACHSIRETDVQGNANFVMAQPKAYLWQWRTDGTAKFLSDFLIRTYPDQHNQLSKRMFKAPEYCAACHKQFIDQEVNRVGWVQLQNQYDNWKASHWFVDGDPEKTIECRECHMPLVASTDPARGDAVDYNRSAQDGMHRSHRFIAANSLVPEMLELPGWQEQVRLTREWLRGETEVPEIAEKWREGPTVTMALEVPERVLPGEAMKVRVVLAANKVGHDFPTGPLDIIQSWVELKVFDPAGRQIYATGRIDERNFIEPGSFLFKAEPVDQYGNLIDRHNLWEMVGVRYRRALFPGYSDTVEYSVDCPAAVAPAEAAAERLAAWSDQTFDLPSQEGLGWYRVEARLLYRKVDQFLINFLLGEGSGVTAPVVEMATAEARVDVRAAGQVASVGALGGAR